MEFTVYKGRNSPFVVPIKGVDGQLYTSTQMAAITRVRCKVNGKFADSTVHTTAFDYSTYSSRGEMIVDLGKVDLTAGSDQNSELVVYDATYTYGRVVDVLQVVIDESCFADGTTAAAVNGAYGLIAQSQVTADHGYSGITEVVTITSAATVGDVLSWNIATQKYAKVNAAALATIPGRVIVVADASALASTCLVMSQGYIRNDSWAGKWPVDNSVKTLYASTTAGEMSATVVSAVGYFSQPLAEICSSVVVFFNPVPGYAEVGT